MKLAVFSAVLLCLVVTAFGTAYAAEISLGAILDGVNNWEGRINYFNGASDKDHPLIGFSVTWTYEFGVAPPDFIGDTISAGAVPVMTWMSCGNDIWDSGYPLQDIIDGKFDDYLRRSAGALKAYGNRILCRFDQEMNLGIWAWSVTAPWNNGDPHQYVEMWRHVVDIFKEEEVHNVEWVWCPNYMSHPFAPWNDAKNFYPGDEYVDWIGIDGYSWGSSNTSGNSTLAVSFPWLYDPIIRDFQCTYLKPILICEIGCLDDARYPKEKWVADAYDYLFHYPFIKGIVWLNTYNPGTGTEEDFRVIRMYDDVLPVPERVSQAYRDAIAGPSFITYFPTLEEAIPQELACDPLPAVGELPKHEVALNKRP
ncbi:MAG: glycosyl hydrolase, partial [bacterium]